jgi:hypothetical protein
MTAVESSKRTGANTDVATMSNKLNNNPMSTAQCSPRFPGQEHPSSREPRSFLTLGTK